MLRLYFLEDGVAAVHKINESNANGNQTIFYVIWCLLNIIYDIIARLCLWDWKLRRIGTKLNEQNHVQEQHEVELKEKTDYKYAI